MADVAAVSHAARQSGRDALWLGSGCHWAGRSEPRKRVEVFAAGTEGRVHRLLFGTDARPGKLAAQQRLFTRARARLLIGRDHSEGGGSSSRIRSSSARPGRRVGRTVSPVRTYRNVAVTSVSGRSCSSAQASR